MLDLLRRLAQAPVAYDSPGHSSYDGANSSPMGLDTLSGEPSAWGQLPLPANLIHQHRDELRQLATQIVMLRRGQVTAFGGVKVLTAGG